MSGDGPASGDRGRIMGFAARLRSIFGRAPAPENQGKETEARGPATSPGLSFGRREMIERVVAFDEKKVVDVMAPRADIFAVDIETPLDELIGIFAASGHSRMPVYRGDLDDPVGMVHIKDIVSLIANGKNSRRGPDPILPSIRRDALYVPPSMYVTDLLLRMQASRIHMALVIDEYGGTDGLVTIEDLIEEIVGEINDEHDEEEASAIAMISNGGWDVDARVELDDFARETGFRLETDDDEIDTVGGYVVSLAGRVPQRGEVLAGDAGFDFEIIEADARKVRKLRIRPSVSKHSEAAE